ncbi:acetyl-CoA carboxylase, biotin carboxyl carrier protein [Spongiactinospora rosea]|uniref:Biotin carboxyl carrier protein of acetyl-CoA carboxylase n=1 Tax=Spongiactinospora rosea TaxID=2248750 RepID=A0A366M1N6_9ACTN|nr:biotin/lipoyl-containing protein [Spongiactinospora rosea]RBQ20086.1 acetyl-CoA carboxylase, biotin carboxyl carrier protein [Spongiactinospora rosea]
MKSGPTEEDVLRDVQRTEESILREVHRVAAELMSSAFTSPAKALPARISVRAGDVAVEVDWPDAGATAAGPAAPHAAPGGVTAPGRIAGEGDHGGREDHGDGLHYIRAGTVGTFYHAPGPGAPPFVSEGDLVQAGQQVAILEVMKLMTPIQADRAGRVEKILVADGEPVEYGTPLIAVVSS